MSEKAGKSITFLPPTEPLNADIKAKLAKIFGDDDLEILAGSIPGAILPRIATAMPDLEAKWLDIATTLINRLQAMGYGKKPEPAAQPATPQRVVVEMPKQLSELTARELLARLADGEGDSAELIGYLKDKPNVALALRRADGKIAVLTADDTLDPAQTHEYVEQLSSAFGEPERLVNGKAPVTLERALKRARMVTVNLLTGKVEYVGRANAYGIVMSDVADDRYQAIVWAAKTGHRFMPEPTTDEFHLTEQHEELFLPDGRRGIRIEQDYGLAKAAGDAETLTVVPRQMTEEQALQLVNQMGRQTSATRIGTSRSAAPQQPVETNWEEVVRRHFRKIEELSSTSGGVSGHNNTIRGHFTSLTVQGHNHYFSDAVVIGSLVISGHNHSGTVFMPPRMAASQSGHGHNIRVVNKSWEDIAGLIDARP